MDQVFVGDAEFIIPFTSQVDLTGMTQVRMLILKPQGAKAVYDFELAEFAGVVVGGTLFYKVRAGDLTAQGSHFFQVVAKDDTGLDIAFQPYELKVAPRIIMDSWEQV